MVEPALTIRDFSPGDQAAARAIDPGGVGTGQLVTGRFVDRDAVVATLVPSHGDEEVVGVGILVPEADGLSRIVRMSVARRHRRRDVARALITELISRARSRGNHALIVSTDTPWIDPVALYEDSGFEVTESDDDDIHFWLDLVWTDETVVTDRTVLQAPTAADNMFVIEMLTDGPVRSFLGGPASFAIVEWIKAHSLAPQWGTFIVHLPDSDLPGERQRIGIVALEDWRGDLELSLQLLPEFWGRGYAHELSQAVLAWAWANTDAPSVIAVSHAGNARAVAAMQRLGFVVERRFEEFGEPHLQGRLPRPG